MVKIIIKSPSDAVFDSTYAKGGKTLFKSQVELAEEILKAEEFSNKNPVTVKSSLSQIFTGERNISKNLQSALFKALEKRFDKNKYDFEEFKNLLLESFRVNYEERLAQKRNKLLDIDYDNLINETKTASELIISTLEPAEIHKSPLADQLKDELLQKVGVFEAEGTMKSASYWFFLPKGSQSYVARDFWEKLRAYILEESSAYTSQTIDDKLLSLNEEGKIRTFLVDINYVLIPSVFLNYRSPKISGYCVSYIVDTPSVAALSNKVVHTWLNEILPKLEDEDNRTEFFFKNLL